MNDDILQGTGDAIERVSADAFVRAMQALPARMAERLAFMTREHHLVRDCVVRELRRQQKPLGPAWIARTIGLDVRSVRRILDELEQRLFFLVRDAEGNVAWAFPVTASATPHRLTFSTGEKIFGA